MLPRIQGRFALHLTRRPRRQVRPASRGMRAALVLALVAGLGMAGPTAAFAKDGEDTWAPSTWTGELAGPPVPGAGLPPAASPAIAQQLPEGYDVDPTYEGQAQCTPDAKAGTQKLADLIKATYGTSQTVWIPRACDVGGQSEHKEGRALDWMTSVRKQQERANAEQFLAWLLGPDQFGKPYGNAMRLGVMYIGWNDRIWRGYDIKRGWTELKGCFATPSEGMDTTCHRNHIHISLTWDGASGRTSFWDGSPMSIGYCDRLRSSATQQGIGRANDPVGIQPVTVLDTRTAVGIKKPCRLQQDTFAGESHRLFPKVLGVGGVPATGVAAVDVTVSGLGANAPSSVRVWSPGETKSDVVAKMEMNGDGTGTATVPVANDGTIALAVSAGASDISVNVTGYYPVGDHENHTKATPGASTAAPADAAPAQPAPAPEPPKPAGQPNSPDPMEPEDFVAIGSEVGYDSTSQGPVQPAEVRTVPLTGIPAEATSVLALVTARESTKKGVVTLGKPGDGTGSSSFAFPKKGIRSGVLVMPVAGSQVAITGPEKATVQMRIEVLGYAVNSSPINVKSVPTISVAKRKLAAGEAYVAPVVGIGTMPKKTKKVSAVVLRVTAKTKGADPGSVKAYGLDGAAPATRSAPVVPGQPFTSLIVSQVGTDGKIVLAPTVEAKVDAEIVGYVRHHKHQ